MKYHSEQLPSAIKRFVTEANRVTSVLETHLSEQKAGTDGTWLVGGKFSYADLSFVPWIAVFNFMVASANKEDYDLEKYPHVKKWFDSMMARSSVKNAMEAAFRQ